MVNHIYMFKPPARNTSQPHW